MSIVLIPLASDDREQFILDDQEAFNYGALEEFGRRDDHFEEEGEIISRETIEAAIDAGEAYRIVQDGQPVGGVVIKVAGDRGDLELLFVSPKAHSKGIGMTTSLLITVPMVISNAESSIFAINTVILNFCFSGFIAKSFR